MVFLDIFIALFSMAIILFVLCLPVFVIVKVLRSGSSEIIPSPPVVASTYKKRRCLMNSSEYTLYQILAKKLPEGFYLFPKMRIADIIETTNGSGYYKKRNKILPKHVDFVVCNNRLEPVLAIELDGGSHNRLDRVERDKEVDAVFLKAGMEIQHIKVGSDFYSEATSIVAKFLVQ